MKRYTAGITRNRIDRQFGEYDYLQDALRECECTLNQRVYIKDRYPNTPNRATRFEFENGKLVHITI